MKHRLNTGAILCLLLTSVCLATGSTATLSWAAPVAYSDASPMASTDIDHYTIAWQPAPGQTGPSGSVNVPAGTLTTQVNIPCGNVTFTVSVTTTATAKFPSTTSPLTNPIPYASKITCAPGTVTAVTSQ